MSATPKTVRPDQAIAPAPAAPLAPFPATFDDQSLLQRFEPVIRYTRGERFFPMDVERYVRASSLWLQRGNEPPVCLVPEGTLTLEKLAEPRSSEFGTLYFIKFIEPLNIAQMAAYTVHEGLARKDPLDLFQAGRGRLARVGYSSRFVDALFSITLLARGSAPSWSRASPSASPWSTTSATGPPTSTCSWSTASSWCFTCTKPTCRPPSRRTFTRARPPRPSLSNDH